MALATELQAEHNLGDVGPYLILTKGFVPRVEIPRHQKAKLCLKVEKVIVGVAQPRWRVDDAAADSAVSADLQALEAELATNLTALADAAAEGRPEAQDAAKLRTLAAQLRRAQVLQEEARKRHRPAARWGEECGDD